MKKLILMLIIAFATVFSAVGQADSNIIWTVFHQVPEKLDFTPDNKYILTWTNTIDILDANNGSILFSIPIDAKSVGDYNYSKQYLVFAKDSTPKLLDWQTKKVVEGFEKADFSIDRIRTAKSKNEFMAKTFGYGNKIYFWDINQKQIIDSVQLDTIFEKGGFKWKRRITEYDYLGNNDEYFYVRYNDDNSIIQAIPPQSRNSNFFYHIYDRETKNLVDSLFVFQQTNEHYYFVDKMQVMNDRSKIAWNNKGGVINFFDVYTKKFYDRLIFDDRDFVQVGDIEFNHDSKLIGLTQGNGCCRYLKIYTLDTKEKILQYNVGSWGQISFSSNNSYLITSIASILSLYGNQWDKTAVPTEGNNSLIITPNPVSNSINIRYSFDSPTNYNFTLYDLTGNQINIIDEGFSTNLNYSTDYNISYLPKGTYFIKLIYGSQSISQKFIKE